MGVVLSFLFRPWGHLSVMRDVYPYQFVAGQFLDFLIIRLFLLNFSHVDFLDFGYKVCGYFLSISSNKLRST